MCQPSSDDGKINIDTKNGSRCKIDSRSVLLIENYLYNSCFFVERTRSSSEKHT